MTRRADVPVGLAEIAEMAGMTKSNAKRLRAEGKLPEADGLLHMGPWWWRSTIEQWLTVPRPKPGRPKGRSDNGN